MSTYISYNGEIISPEKALFTSNNRAFRYGDGLFESMRLVNGQVMFSDLHVERLTRGMELLRFSNVSSFNKSFIESSVLTLTRKNNLYKNARIRLTVFRNEGGYYSPEKNTFSFLIEVSPVDTEAYTLNRKGLIIDVYDGARKDFGVLSSLKTNNALIYVLAGIHKTEAGIDECILLNSKGNMVEGMHTNIFVVKNNTLYTPDITEGCTDGVMRKVVIQLANKNGIAVSEEVLSPGLIPHADEIFLTNAVQGIQWVVGYREKRFFSKYSKILSEELRQLKNENL